MPKTYNDLYLATRTALKSAGVEAYALEARLLVAYAVGKTKEEFVRDLRLYTSDENEQKIHALLQRRIAGEPLAYLIGEWEFHGLPIVVTPDVLIPRMDTEVLVDAALQVLVGRKMNARILDLCSGSGCIGCALAHELPAARVVMVDISDAALAVSKENLRRNRQNRTICLKADALEKPPMSIGTFDIIVSNPPYVASMDILTLDSSVRDYEPLGALDLKMRKEMQTELKAMHKKLGITFIYVTHDQEEALTMSDTIVVMKDGCIQQIGTPADIYNEPANAFVADFIGDSNILSGTMVQNLTVRFCNHNFACVDDFARNEKVDVVVRPEDIRMTDPESGMIQGKVIGVVFKGVHYEITVKVGKTELIIQSTESRTAGEIIGMNIAPDDIHIMKKEFSSNKYDGYITKKNTVVFGDGEFDCDLTQLYPASHMDEEGYLVTAAGEKLDLTDVDVTVEVGLSDIEISDNADEGGARGHIVSIIYKGDHYQLIVRTEENEEDYVFDTEDLWNENDYVSVKIRPEKIRLKLKEEAAVK